MFAIPSLKKMQKNRGFSLVELMTVVAVLAIVIVGAGYASYRMGILHAKTATQQIKASFEHGRLVAMQENESVVLCPRNMAKAEPTCMTGTQGKWQTRQLMVFTSDERKPPYDPEHDQMIAMVALPQNADVLVWSGFGSANYIVIQPGGTAASNGTLRYCQGNVALNGMVINALARVRYLSPQELAQGC